MMTSTELAMQVREMWSEVFWWLGILATLALGTWIFFEHRKSDRLRMCKCGDVGCYERQRRWRGMTCTEHEGEIDAAFDRGVNSGDMDRTREDTGRMHE